MNKITKLAATAALTAALGTAAAACGGNDGGSGKPSKPSVQACASAYPAWFADSAAAGKTTATPAACKGLTEDQVAEIGEKYLAQQAGGS